MPTSHGHAKRAKPSRTYNSWRAMRQRCFNDTRDSYPRYGGRGITICDEWESFELFLEDMGVRPPFKSLERKNVNGNYDKENCKWANKFEQRHNRTDTQ